MGLPCVYMCVCVVVAVREDFLEEEVFEIVWV